MATGKVELDKKDIQSKIVSFNSNDSLNPDKYEEIELLKSKESLKELLEKLSTMVKNSRLTNSLIGDSDISSISDDICSSLLLLHDSSSVSILKNSSIINIADGIDAPLISDTIYGKSTQSSTPAPDAPVNIVSIADDGEINNIICGKNIMPNSATYDGWVSANQGGCTILDETYNGGKILKLTKSWGYMIPPFAICLDADTYTISFDIKTTTDNVTDNGNVYINGLNKYLYIPISNEFIRVSHTFTMAKAGKYTHFVPMIANNGTSPIYIANIQIEKGDSATEYEPNEYEEIAITSLPLYGIPVSSNGNYTDKAGQQWVCDTIEYTASGTGVYTKRVGVIELNGSEKWTYETTGTGGGYFKNTTLITNYKKYDNLFTSTHFPKVEISKDNTEQGIATYNNSIYIRWDALFASVAELKDWLNENNVVLLYQLSTPEVTELTEEQVNQFKKLKSSDEITNIYTLDGAEMNIEYLRCNTISKIFGMILNRISAIEENNINE